MSEAETLDQVRRFVQEAFLYMRPDFKLAEETPLLQTGVIDSMGVMDVLGFLEDNYDLVPSDYEITEVNIGYAAGHNRVHPPKEEPCPTLT